MTAAELVQHLTRSQRDLLADLQSLTDDGVRRPSRLPGWTRDMVLAHLSHGAAAQQRGIAAAVAGEDSTMYPGGEEQREAEIAAGAGRPAAELVAGLAAACAELEALLAGLSDDAWDAPVLSRRGPVPVRVVVLQRWLDVEAHRVDLDLGHTSADWPDALVAACLPMTMAAFPAFRARPDADRTVTGSWHLHRTDGPGEWTVHADAERAWVTEEHGKGDCAVRGPGRALLALALGRPPADDVTVFGDEALAGRLKAAFPGP